MFITSTADIMYLVIAIAVAFLTIFLCTWLFYAIRVTRRFDSVSKILGDHLGRWQRAVEGSFGYLGMLGEGLKALVGYFLETREQKTKSKSKK
jgi:hypothetical protein